MPKYRMSKKLFQKLGVNDSNCNRLERESLTIFCSFVFNSVFVSVQACLFISLQLCFFSICFCLIMFLSLCAFCSFFLSFFLSFYLLCSFLEWQPCLFLYGSVTVGKAKVLANINLKCEKVLHLNLLNCAAGI